MILPEELSKIAQKSQTSVLNVARDYLQSLFLSYFYQQKESTSFFFKGGTALHFVFKSPRFSEDLDFSAKAFNCGVFEDLLARALLSIERSGIKTDLIEAKSTSGGCLAIFSGRLGEITVKIQIEVSLRVSKDLKGELVLVKTEFLPSFNILILDEETLVGGKIEALLTRKKPRDFYDFYFILRANLLQAKEKSVLYQVLKVLEGTQINFERELKIFLPKSHWSIIRDFRKTLKGEIERFR